MNTYYSFFFVNIFNVEGYRRPVRSATYPAPSNSYAASRPKPAPYKAGYPSKSYVYPKPPSPKRFIPVIGNHDTVAVNLYVQFLVFSYFVVIHFVSVHQKKKNKKKKCLKRRDRFAPAWANQTFSSAALYGDLYELWKEFIPVDQFHSFRKGGYYSVLLGRNLRVIVLNTQLCFRLNLWNVVEVKDPSGQLKWLTEQLAEAEQLDQQVHLLGHIAPDQRSCSSVWLHNFLRILGRFEDTIKAQFYGHNHLDEVRVYWSRTSAKKLNNHPINPFPTHPHLIHSSPIIENVCRRIIFQFLIRNHTKSIVTNHESFHCQSEFVERIRRCNSAGQEQADTAQRDRTE